MVKHLLIPADGSPLSESAALKGIELARTLGARVTALHVSPRLHVMTYGTEMLGDTRDEYERDSPLHAERYLDFVAKAATQAGVAWDTVRRVGDDVTGRSSRSPRTKAATPSRWHRTAGAGLPACCSAARPQHVLTHSVIPVVVWR